GLGLLKWQARAYRAKRTSDQLALVDAWWLIYTLWICVVIAVQAGFFGLFGFVAFAAYWVVSRVRLRPLGIPATPPRLLLLRVFGYRHRTEDLVATVARFWRYTGSVQLIAGVDVATTN